MMTQTHLAMQKRKVCKLSNGSKPKITYITACIEDTIKVEFLISIDGAADSWSLPALELEE